MRQSYIKRLLLLSVVDKVRVAIFYDFNYLLSGCKAYLTLLLDDRKYTCLT